MWVCGVLIYRVECGVWEGVRNIWGADIGYECVQCVECEGVWSMCSVWSVCSGM